MDPIMVDPARLRVTAPFDELAVTFKSVGEAIAAVQKGERADAAKRVTELIRGQRIVGVHWTNTSVRFCLSQCVYLKFFLRQKQVDWEIENGTSVEGALPTYGCCADETVTLDYPERSEIWKKSELVKGRVGSSAKGVFGGFFWAYFYVEGFPILALSRLVTDRGEDVLYWWETV